MNKSKWGHPRLWEDSFHPEEFWLSPHRAWKKLYRATNLKDKGDHYLLTMEVPGFQKEEITIYTEKDSVLVVEGNRKEDKEQETSDYLIRERYQGSFQRKFPLEQGQLDKVKATLKQGILLLEVPKAAQTDSRKNIPIEDI